MANDLISRSKAIRRLMACSETWTNVGSCSDCKAEVLKSIIEMVKAQAAVDAEPVRHGTWIYMGDGLSYRWKCSECGLKEARIHFYCPRCGAKMGGGTRDE